MAFRLLLPGARHFAAGSLQPAGPGPDGPRPPLQPAAAPAVRDRRAVHDGVRRGLHGDRLPADRGAVLPPAGHHRLDLPGLPGRHGLASAGGAAGRPGWAAGARCTWRSARRPRVCCSPWPTRWSPVLLGLVLITGGLLRGARGRLVVGEPDGDDGPRAGVGALPVRVLPRAPARAARSAPSPSTRGAGPARWASGCWRCSASCRSRCSGHAAARADGAPVSARPACDDEAVQADRGQGAAAPGTATPTHLHVSPLGTPLSVPCGSFRRAGRDGARQEMPQGWVDDERQYGDDDDRPRRQAGETPRRADRVLLPHARLLLRGRGRGAGHDGPRLAQLREVRGPLQPALVAVPHRDERLPGHADRGQQARPPDGSDRVDPAGPGRAAPAPRQHLAGADAGRPRAAHDRPTRRRRPSPRSRCGSPSWPPCSSCRPSSGRC